MSTVLEYKYNKTFVLKELTIGGTHANSGPKRIKGTPLGWLLLGKEGQGQPRLPEGGRPLDRRMTFSSGSADVRKGRFERRLGECVRAW